MTTPERVSAVCWIREPTRLTGAVKPDSGIEMYSTGIAARAQSTRFWEVTSLHLSGLVGQQEKIVRGFAASSSAEPRTASWSSFMSPKASMVKAPVTTGFSQFMRPR